MSASARRASEWLRRLSVALAAGALVGCAQLPGSPPDSMPDADQMSRQVMIMLPSSSRVALRPFEYSGGGYASGPARNRALRTAASLAREHGVVVLDDWAMPSLDIHCIVARLPEGRDASAVLAALNNDARVAWAQPMERFRALNAPDRVPVGDAAPSWGNLDSLHKIATGRRVRIAQIDTGVDLRHPVLSGQVSGPRNFVDNRSFPAELHGTAVAGVIVARADPKTGLVGVSPGARVMPLRACWEVGSAGAACSTFTLAKSLQYALREEPRVINLSITGPQDRLLGRLIDRALDQGIVVVAAGDESGGPGFPATHPRVLAVYGHLPPASSGALLQAPGEDILTATPNGTFAFLSGSSYSAAHVSGLAALLLELSPGLTPAQVEALLHATAMGRGRDTRVTRIDPCAALSAVALRAGPACASAQAGLGNQP